MKKLAVSALALVALAFPAIAAKRSVNVPLTSFLVTGSGGLAPATITFSDVGVSGISTQFVLPHDYKEGSPVYLRLNFDAGSTCNMHLVLMDLSRYRLGKQMSVALGSATLLEGNMVVLPAPHVLARKSVKIASGNYTFFSGQKPGDTIYIQLMRGPDDPNDTCTTVNLRSAEFRYTLK